MTQMKEYMKMMRELSRDDRFEMTKSDHRNTIKLKHIASDTFYTIHPGDKAVKPLRSWIKKQENEMGKL